ncbi:fimbrial protein [Cupriavidus sp. 2TAF22]|uniref:fimbrial protein n=1 Tax=unclassified Cupriavidus TaxID=2640874 RepID=UPI003F921C31
MRKLILLLALLASTPALASCDQFPTTDGKPFRYRLTGFNPPTFNPLVADGTVLYSGDFIFHAENSGPVDYQCQPFMLIVGRLEAPGPYHTMSTPINGVGIRMQYTDNPGWWPWSHFSMAVSVQEATELRLTIQLVKTGPITAGGILSGEVAAKWYRGGELKSTQYMIDGMLAIKPLVPTCKLSSAHISVPMRNVPIGDFKGVGSTANENPFEVALSCADGISGATTNVYATLTDMTDPANRGDVLTLSPGSTAQGVGIQVLKDSTPLRYGADSSAAGNLNQWFAGSASNGLFNIPLRARYVQTLPDVAAGTANGRATITMSYQ